MSDFWQDADHMREVWHINETFQIPYNPVADVDGDGRLDLVYTRSNSDGEAPFPASVVNTERTKLIVQFASDCPNDAVAVDQSEAL
jgi:hypothetical protein